MRLTYRDSQLAVLDEVFEEDKFKQIWEFFNNIDFFYRHTNQYYKVWRVNDGQILSGQGLNVDQFPTNTPYDYVDYVIRNLAKEHLSDIVGEYGKDWFDVSYTPYIYPAGTKISWHDDFGYTGAAIFYPHQEWSPYWGGELFVAKTPSPEEGKEIVAKSGKTSDKLERDFVNPILNAYGLGMYVSPLPNRLAVTSGSVWHAINRVDQAAGDHLRCSFVAFFLKNKPENFEEKKLSFNHE
jgi:hypothetical protein